MGVPLPLGHWLFLAWGAFSNSQFLPIRLGRGQRLRGLELLAWTPLSYESWPQTLSETLSPAGRVSGLVSAARRGTYLLGSAAVLLTPSAFHLPWAGHGWTVLGTVSLKSGGQVLSFSFPCPSPGLLSCSSSLPCSQRGDWPQSTYR
jgi:hypothetical protein